MNARVLWNITPLALDRSATRATPSWPVLSMLEALYPIEHSRSLSNPYIGLQNAAKMVSIGQGSQSPSGTSPPKNFKVTLREER